MASSVVGTMEPETPADPAAVLLQLLTAIGAACGRGAGFTADGTAHGINLFTQVVGDSAVSKRLVVRPGGRARP